MKQNEFDQKEFKFCRNILMQKKTETLNVKQLNSKVNINSEFFRNKQTRKTDVKFYLD